MKRNDRTKVTGLKEPYRSRAIKARSEEKKNIQLAKDLYKKEKGLKIARGFSKTTTAKAIKENTAKKIYLLHKAQGNKKKRDKRRAELEAVKVKEKEQAKPQKDIIIWDRPPAAEDAPFYSVLNYGGLADRLARARFMELSQLDKTKNKPFEVRIDYKPNLYSPKTIHDFDVIIKDIYQKEMAKIRKAEKDKKIKISSDKVSTVTIETGKNSTTNYMIIVVNKVTI